MTHHIHEVVSVALFLAKEDTKGITKKFSQSGNRLLNVMIRCVNPSPYWVWKLDGLVGYVWTIEARSREK